MIIGTCSLCCGPVECALGHAYPKCLGCGATKKNPYGPVIEMEKPNAPDANIVMTTLEDAAESIIEYGKDLGYWSEFVIDTEKGTVNMEVVVTHVNGKPYGAMLEKNETVDVVKDWHTQTDGCQHKRVVSLVSCRDCGEVL